MEYPGACSIFFTLYTKEVLILNKVTSIFFIVGMLGKKENKDHVVRKSKNFSLRAIDQVSGPIFWTIMMVSAKTELGR